MRVERKADAAWVNFGQRFQGRDEVAKCLRYIIPGRFPKATPSLECSMNSEETSVVGAE